MSMHSQHFASGCWSDGHTPVKRRTEIESSAGMRMWHVVGLPVKDVRARSLRQLNSRSTCCAVVVELLDGLIRTPTTPLTKGGCDAMALECEKSISPFRRQSRDWLPRDLSWRLSGVQGVCRLRFTAWMRRALAHPPKLTSNLTFSSIFSPGQLGMLLRSSHGTHQIRQASRSHQSIVHSQVHARLTTSG
jgi:hypothetical protein